MKKKRRGDRLVPIAEQPRDADLIETTGPRSARQVHERGLLIARQTFIDYAETFRTLARS